MMKKIVAAACAACLTLQAAAFDLSDYAATYRIYLADYLQKMDDFRVPNAQLRAFMDIGTKNGCEIGYSSAAINVITNEMDFTLGAGGHYSAIYETFQVSAQQCGILHACSDSDTTCRASYRACMASAISAERVNDLGNDDLGRSHRQLQTIQHRAICPRFCQSRLLRLTMSTSTSPALKPTWPMWTRTASALATPRWIQPQRSLLLLRTA